MIRLLGDVVVRLDGRPLPELATPRLERLLGRLAFAPATGLRRDRLAFELWPDSTEPQARTNLRKLLHDLRQLFTDPETFLDAGPRIVRWREGAPIWIDVVAFAEALDRNDRTVAVRHYRGPLLPASYEDWALAERERLRSLAADALAGLAAVAEAERRDDEVVDHLLQLLAIDPLRESGYRLLMEALARRGNRSEALITYHRCVATLEEELGVAPEAATVEVYTRLRAWRGDGDASTATESRPALIGRDREWRIVHAAWEAAAGGSARFLLVTGEAGVGKTRLVEELATRATAEGHAVGRTRAYEAAGGLPWGPVVDWLRSDAVRPGLDDLDDAGLAQLARLLPELRDRRPGVAGASLVIEAARLHLLLDAVCRGLLGRRRPLMFVLDDLQWCDTDTLDLCAFLLRSSPAAPVLVVATARDDEIGEDHPVATLQRRLAKDATLTTLALGRLGPEATAEVAAVAGVRSLDADDALRLWNETEGNPLFVIEAVRAGFGSAEAVGRAVLTPTVQAVIRTRLDRLTPQARHLAEIAATIGREFTPGILESAAGASDDDLADALDELWRRHILREQGSTYDFSHDRLRDVALGAISPARRRRLHRAVATALEDHHVDDLGPVSARLAVHYESAALYARAVEAYERAAAHAYGVFALDDAIALLNSALRLLDQLPPGATRDETELGLRSAQGVALGTRLGYGASAVRHGYDRALALHRRLGRPPSAAVLRGLALYAVTACDFDRATEMGDALVVGGPKDHTALVEGAFVLGVTAFWRGEFVTAERRLAQAIHGYRAEDAPLHIARYGQDPKGACLSRLALTQLFRAQPEQAGRTMLEALRFVEKLEHPMTTGYVRAFDAILAAFAPDHHDLNESLAALIAVTSEMRIGYFEKVARMLCGWRDVLGGDLGGIDIMRTVTDDMRREQQLHMTLGLSLLARGYLHAGDVGLGRAAVADALRWTESRGQSYLLAELFRIDAELLAEAGDRLAANVTCTRAVEVAVEQGSGWLGDRALATLSRIEASER